MGTKKLYKPKDNFYTTVIRNFIWGVLGIIMGILMNKTFMVVFNTFEINSSIVKDTIKLILCAFVLTYIQFSHNYFGWTWQNTTPGLFFTWFFFGIQTLYKERY